MAIIIKDKNGNPTHVAGLGKQGPTGKSAYQYAVEAGFTGTESEFAALVGMRSNQNLLDNWYFVGPINQRKQEEYINDEFGSSMYTIDRWQLQGKGTVTINDDSITIVKSPVSYTNLIQTIDLQEYNLYEKTLTFSCLFSENVGFCVRLIGSNVPIGVTENGFDIRSQENEVGLSSVTVPYYTSTRYLQICITADTDSESSVDKHVKVIAAKLELGPVQTLAHKDASGNWVLNDPPPNKALELAKCQRYYNILQPEALLVRNVGIRDELLLQYPEMRITPSASIISHDPTSSGLACRKVSSKSLIVCVDAEDARRDGAWVYKVILDANL